MEASGCSISFLTTHRIFPRKKSHSYYRLLFFNNNLTGKLNDVCIPKNKKNIGKEGTYLKAH